MTDHSTTITVPERPSAAEILMALEHARIGLERQRIVCRWLFVPASWMRTLRAAGNYVKFMHNHPRNMQFLLGCHVIETSHTEYDRNGGAFHLVAMGDASGGISQAFYLLCNFMKSASTPPPFSEDT